MMILVICFICCVVCRVGDRSGRSRSNKDLADAVLYVLSKPPHVQIRKNQLNVFAVELSVAGATVKPVGELFWSLIYQTKIIWNFHNCSKIV
jgi:hypothetical protein